MLRTCLDDLPIVWHGAGLYVVNPHQLAEPALRSLLLSSIIHSTTAKFLPLESINCWAKRIACIRQLQGTRELPEKVDRFLFDQAGFKTCHFTGEQDIDCLFNH